MVVKFKDKVLEEIYKTSKTKDKRYIYICRRKQLIEGYIRAVSIMCRVESTKELRYYSFLHYEKLRYQNSPMSSLRIVNNSIERLLFTESESGIEVELIEIDKTHYGNKK